MSIATALLALAAAAGPTAAQAPDLKRVAKIRTFHRAYSRCLVRKRGPQVEQAILADTDSPTLLDKMSNYVMRDCMSAAPGSGPVMMRIDGDQLRYGVADVLVSRDFPRPFTGSFTAIPALSHRPATAPKIPNANPKYAKLFEAYEARLQVQAEAYEVMNRFGECVARRDPQATHRLLLTEPTTPEELAALRGVRPVLGTCLVKGDSFKVELPTLRGTLAENFYRLAKASAAASVVQEPN